MASTSSPRRSSTSRVRFFDGPADIEILRAGGIGGGAIGATDGPAGAAAGGLVLSLIIDGLGSGAGTCGAAAGAAGRDISLFAEVSVASVLDQTVVGSCQLHIYAECIWSEESLRVVNRESNFLPAVPIIEAAPL